MPTPTIKWTHLRHKKKDTQQQLKTKLNKLKKIETQLLEELAKFENEEECESPFWRCVGSLRVQFPYSVVTSAVSPCYQHLAILFTQTPTLDSALIGVFRFGPTDFEFEGSIEIHIQNEEFRNLHQSFTLTVQTDLVLILSSVFTLKKSDQQLNSISVLSLTNQDFKLKSKLNTEKWMRCVISTETELIAAGDEGTVFVWNWTDLDSNCEDAIPNNLPQACYKDYHISCIFKCVIFEPKEETNPRLLFGLSTQGSLAIWNLKKFELLSVMHHCQFHLQDLQVLQEERGQPPMTISMIGLVSERKFSMNRFTPGKLAAMKFQENEVTIGKPFPDQTITFISAQTTLGLLNTDQGHITLWNIKQGRELWTIKDSNESSIVWLDWNEAERSILMAKADGSLVQLKLKK